MTEYASTDRELEKANLKNLVLIWLERNEYKKALVILKRLVKIDEGTEKGGKK